METRNHQRIRQTGCTSCIGRHSRIDCGAQVLPRLFHSTLSYSGWSGWATRLGPCYLLPAFALLAISRQKDPVLIFHTVIATDYLIAVTFAVIDGNKNTKTHNFYYTQPNNRKLSGSAWPSSPKGTFLVPARRLSGQQNPLSFQSFIGVIY